MSAIMLSAKCIKCNTPFENLWVDRSPDGRPNLQAIPCGNCGGRQCLVRDWGEQKVNPIIPPLENGQVNRFEYSYTNDKGKTVTKKMDPKMVDKHFVNNSKKY